MSSDSERSDEPDYGDRILALIQTGQRAVFHPLLEDYVRAAPSIEAIKEQAEKYPDRYAQGLTIMARLAGFHDRSDTANVNVFVDIGGMSDMELRERIRECLDSLQVVNAIEHAAPNTEDQS